jgi:hypothetical protein
VSCQLEVVNCEVGVGIGWCDTKLVVASCKVGVGIGVGIT